jgi:cell division protease FtsH
VLKSFFGPVPEYVPGGHYIGNNDQLKNFGRIEYIVSLCGLNMLPIFVYLAYTSHGCLKDEYDNHFWPWFEKKRSEWVNWLKGGAYLKEAMRAAEEIEEVTFNDLVGLQNVKEELGCIVSYLENPESFDRIHTTPPKGILLIGDTRTGKSHSVKALFGEIGRMLKRLNRKQEFQFLEFTAAEINQYGIAYLLNLVKQHAPCVVFIDEIDLLDLQRKGKNEMLSQFLTCMSGTLDKTDPKNQVILIAATNRPENLDKALRQPGRFGKEIRFEYPTFKDRREFILRKLDKLSLSPQFFDVDTLARETEGASFEALNSLINTSVLKSRLRGQSVNQAVMEEAINEVIYHTVPNDGKDVSPREKQILASHFAGYAAVLNLLDTGMRLSRVTIRQVMTNIKEEAMGMHLYQKKEDGEEQKRFINGRVFVHHDFDPINIASREEKLAQICYHVAGTIAEEMLIGSCGYSCHREGLEKAILTAQSITFEGIEPSRWPKHAQRIRFDEALVLVEDCKQRVRKIFEEHKEALAAVAEILQEQETLSGSDIANIIYAVEHRDEIIASLKRQQEQKAAQAQAEQQAAASDALALQECSEARTESMSREVPLDDLAQEITAG